MKLDKELLTKHAKRLKAILSEKSTFAPYIAKADFARVLENSLNTLHAAQKKLTNVELANKLSATTLVKEYNKLGKNEFKLDDKFKYDDEGDLIDNINYLVTFCNNIFKANLDDLVEGKQVTVSNPTINLKAKPEVDDAAGGMAFAGAASYENPFVMGQAYAKVKEDIATGKVYMYKSKPRAMVGVKIAQAITLSLTIITLIIASIFAFMSKDFQVLYQKSGGGTQQGPLNFNAIGPGIMYILVAGFGVYPLYQIINGFKTKNDNLKYHFNWPWVLIFILMLLCFVLSDMRVTWLLSPGDIKETVGTKAWQAFQNWKIMYVVSLSCGGTCLIPMIIGAVINPKEDKEGIEKSLKGYADQAMAAGFGQQPIPPQTKADVQKPVDVKKPTKPKSKTDSKSKTKK